MTFSEWKEPVPPSLGVPHGRIVFTNGCFDLITHGHCDFLRRCRALGDWLIVGLNSDASVRRLKGPTRPICNQEERASVLRAIRYVDEIIVFEEDTPCELIERIRPSIAAKGPGYSEENMPEAEIVKAYGGRVVILDGPDVSTSKIAERIVKSVLENEISCPRCREPSIPIEYGFPNLRLSTYRHCPKCDSTFHVLSLSNDGNQVKRI